MRRRFGNPGRVDLAAISPGPAEPFIGSGYLQSLAGFIAVAVVLLGAAMLAAAVFRGAQHLQLLALAHGG